MMVITDPAGETGRETVGIDMQGIDLLIDGDGGVENAIIVIGETTLMKGLEDAARTLLTRGPVVEATTTKESHLPALKR